MKIFSFVVLVREHESADRWADCGEGPWGSYALAEEFADAEVGADYVIVAVVKQPVHGATGERVGL